MSILNSLMGRCGGRRQSGCGDNTSLLFFFLLLVVIFCNCCMFEDEDSLLFFFLLLVILFCGYCGEGDCGRGGECCDSDPCPC